MKKVLLIQMDGFQKCLQHIVDHLSENGITVFHEVIKVSGSGNSRERFSDSTFIKEQKEVNYDYIIWCEHSTEEHLDRFGEQLGIPSICLEHDILTLQPQTSSNNKAVFAFTLPHYDWLIKEGYNAVKAKWYKLGVKPDEISIDTNPLNNALIIGSDYEPFVKIMPKKEQFKYAHLFDTTYYKYYQYAGETHVKGTLGVTEEFLGAAGTVNCPRLAKFWFVINSSSYLDALLFGCMPIVYGGETNPYFKKIGEVNNIVSEGLFYGELPIKYIDCDRLEEKLNALRNNITYKYTLEKLKEDWFFNEELPSVEEELVKLING